jgi:hypothetical protein
MAQSLVLGAFSLTATDGTTQVLSEGTTRGNPMPIETAVKSWLQDGSIVVTQNHDNREVHIRVRFFGADLTALATKEATLLAELNKQNTLTWTPSNGPASVFRVVTSSLDYDDGDDTGEGQAKPWRTFNLRLVCEAFVASATETVTAALAASGTTTTLVNDGSATTNWTGTADGAAVTPSVSSGAVKVTNGSATFGAHTISATLTTSITTSSTKYIVVDWKPEDAERFYTTSLRGYGDGTELTRIAEVSSPTAGFIRTTFQVGAAVSSIAALRLDSFSDDGWPASWAGNAIRSLYVDNINRTDVKPSLGTARQLLRQVPVTGSARTQGRLAIEHSTNALGDAMVYVYPDKGVAYVPPLRPYRVAGGATVTGDGTLVSGSFDGLTSGQPSTFDVPVSQLVPGPHLLVAKYNGTTTDTLSWTVSTRVGSTTLGSAVTGTKAVVASSQAIVVLGTVLLPTVDVAGGSASTVVRVVFSVATGGVSVNLDEVWLFNTNIGALVGPVACGTGAAAAGGPARRLFIEPPSLTFPRPRVLVGHSADQSDAFFPVGALSGWDFPQFTPSRVNVFTVTTNALEAGVTLSHYPRWHSNAGS